jgi:hypothetical protein
MLLQPGAVRAHIKKGNSHLVCDFMRKWTTGGQRGFTCSSHQPVLDIGRAELPSVVPKYWQQVANLKLKTNAACSGMFNMRCSGLSGHWFATGRL